MALGDDPFGQFCGHFLIAGALIHTQLDVQRLSSEAPPLWVLELPGLSVPCQDSRVLLGPASASPPGAVAVKLSPGWGWVVPDSSYFPLLRDHCPFWYLVFQDCCLVYSACLL